MNRSPAFRFDDPDVALQHLAEHLKSVGILKAQIPRVGQVLASAVMADRDSPAADVSAMDGYAIVMSDLEKTEAIPIHGESAAGAEPPPRREGSVMRVFTGAIVPSGFEAVVKREDTEESDQTIRLLDSAKSIESGTHIRRAGENARGGSRVLSPGIQIHAANRATMANFGCRSVDVFQSVRVSIVTTGDEVGEFADQAPKPWQLRNSNQESISALLESLPWVQVARTSHCHDDRGSLTELLRELMQSSDAILLTGGVSMGDYDYVPDVIRDTGGEVVFHGLPIRPGKPILGAATNDGKLLMGLPGNPVSATVCCLRMGIPMLAKLAGLDPWMPIQSQVRLVNPDSKQIPLQWMRLVHLVENGAAEVVPSLGSGDLVSLGHSSGFVVIPPNTCGEGPWPYFSWS